MSRLADLATMLRPQRAFVAATLLLAAAVWLPPLTLQRPTWRYLVTFDVTQSMDVPDQLLDGVPVSRLAMSRAAARLALARLPCGSQLGWSVFADYRVMLLMAPVEVCANHEGLLAALEAIDGRMRWANASKVGKGASWVVRTARAIDPQTRAVFLTDGHESPPLRSASETPPVQDLTPGEIGGWLIGVGGDLPQRIPRHDDDGRDLGFWAAEDVVQRFGPDTPGTAHEHLSELREPHLRALGDLLGLGYRRLSHPSDLADAMLDPALVTRAPVPTDLRWLPALLGLAVLVGRFVPEGWRRRTRA
ncbi:MxaL protein [Sphaerotilus mobilis]|uniref:MxaL protein n=1 Tax=Sphaerotilus mobilis TaxID=47994 RepID=A0A4Q7LVL1_9BURK|nr:MxaL protein [Sphaerotilus mobilis]RZS58771.1 mxaL protein [Sphaerotilus mobilis]